MKEWANVSKAVLCFLLMTIVMSVLLFFTIKADSSSLDSRNKLLVIQAISSVVQSALAGVVASLLVFNRVMPRFVERNVNIGVFMLAVIGIGVCQPLVSWASFVNEMLLTKFHLDWAIEFQKVSNATVAHLISFETPIDWILSIVVIAILPAFCEEIFFRGVLQRTLIKATSSTASGIALSAIFFSLMHFDIAGFLPRAILGVMLGLIFYYSGNLWLSILAHTINNAAVVIMLGLTTDTNNTIEKQLSQSAENPGPWLPIVSLLLCIYIVYRFKAWHSMTKSNTEEEK
ncbi:MAG: CPBP family intramembrane metalloprotease [Marinilabiliaceae bacterium]|nr:CPBP family intramembrane metalloprotease [Marinilabiliaceae bacterium]